eukprot:g4126.t1
MSLAENKGGGGCNIVQQIRDDESGAIPDVKDSSLLIPDLVSSSRSSSESSDGSSDGDVGTKTCHKSNRLCASSAEGKRAKMRVLRCKRAHCRGFMTLIGDCVGDELTVGSAKQRAIDCSNDKNNEKFKYHGSCGTCSVCGDRPVYEGKSRRKAWQRYCALCDDVFAVNGFWAEHGGSDLKCNEKPLTKRSKKHKELMIRLAKDAASQTPKHMNHLSLLEAERKWICAATKDPSLISLSTINDDTIKDVVVFPAPSKAPRTRKVARPSATGKSPGKRRGKKMKKKKKKIVKKYEQRGVNEEELYEALAGAVNCADTAVLLDFTTSDVDQLLKTTESEHMKKSRNVDESVSVVGDMHLDEKISSIMDDVSLDLSRLEKTNRTVSDFSVDSSQWTDIQISPMHGKIGVGGRVSPFSILEKKETNTSEEMASKSKGKGGKKRKRSSRNKKTSSDSQLSFDDDNLGEMDLDFLQNVNSTTVDSIGVFDLLSFVGGNGKREKRPSLEGGLGGLVPPLSFRQKSGGSTFGGLDSPTLGSLRVYPFGGNLQHSPLSLGQSEFRKRPRLVRSTPRQQSIVSLRMQRLTFFIVQLFSFAILVFSIFVILN